MIEVPIPDRLIGAPKNRTIIMNHHSRDQWCEYTGCITKCQGSNSNFLFASICGILNPFFEYTLKICKILFKLGYICVIFISKVGKLLLFKGKERKEREKNASLILKASHYILKQYSGILIGHSKMGINS